MTVLVTAANGDQGGEAAIQFRAQGFPVRALVTDPGKPTAHRPPPTAHRLAALGAELVVGDLASAADLRRALRGVTAVYAVPVGAGEHLLIEEALAAGVETFVQTTVANLADHLNYSDPGTGHSFDEYALSRLRIESHVREAGFPHWTILQPAYFMENFLGAKARGMHPGLSEARLDSAIAEHVKIQLIAARDIAAFGVAAVRNPELFSHQEIALAAEALTMREIAEILGEAAGSAVSHTSLTVAEALTSGFRPGVAHAHKWISDRGYRAPLAEEQERVWGIRPIGLRAWAASSFSLSV